MPTNITLQHVGCATTCLRFHSKRVAGRLCLEPAVRLFILLWLGQRRAQRCIAQRRNVVRPDAAAAADDACAGVDPFACKLGVCVQKVPNSVPDVRRILLRRTQVWRELEPQGVKTRVRFGGQRRFCECVGVRAQPDLITWHAFGSISMSRAHSKMRGKKEFYRRAPGYCWPPVRLPPPQWQGASARGRRS